MSSNRAERHTASPPGVDPGFAPLSEGDLAYRVAEIVAERRTQLGWSQGDLGEAVGMRQPHISRLESSRGLVSQGFFKFLRCGGCW